MEKQRRLCIMISARDRNNLTLKTIESIRLNSKRFDDIIIYVFDNLSKDINNRMNIFSKLLEENIIQYYSFDTKCSTTSCFPKSILFQRWLQMIKIDIQIKTIKKLDSNFKHYFALIDNDMILCPDWDRYFIAACDQITKYEPNIKFLVKFPGGVNQNNSKKYRLECKDKYTEANQFDVFCNNHGGSSGFWFMSYDMLKDLEWPIELLSDSHLKFKKQDVFTWKFLNEKYPNKNYVAAVGPPNDTYPLVLHLGLKLGSICNSLSMNRYGAQYEHINKLDSNINNVSVGELIKLYKNETWATKW